MVSLYKRMITTLLASAILVCVAGQHVAAKEKLDDKSDVYGFLQSEKIKDRISLYERLNNYHVNYSLANENGKIRVQIQAQEPQFQAIKQFIEHPPALAIKVKNKNWETTELTQPMFSSPDTVRDVDCETLRKSGLPHIHEKTIPAGLSYISIDFSKQDYKALESVTRKYLKQQMGIFIKDQLLFAPIINAPVTKGPIMIDGDGEIFEDPTKLRALVKELNASPEALTFKIQQNGQWIDSQFKPSKVLAEVVADSARTSCSSSDIVFQFNPNYPRLKEKYIVKNTQLGVFFGDQQLYSLQKHPDPKSHYPLIAPLASNDLALQFISDWKVNTKDVYPMEILKAEASEVNRKPALENT